MSQKFIRTSMPRLGQISQRVAQPIFRRYGPVLGRIFSEWETIVGSHVAHFAQARDLTFPYQKKVGGILHLNVAPGSAPVVQHMEQTIIERCNAFFGYKALSRIRLHHGGFVSAPAGEDISKDTPLSDVESRWIARHVEDIDSPELQNCLREWGESLLGDKK